MLRAASESKDTCVVKPAPCPGDEDDMPNTSFPAPAEHAFWKVFILSEQKAVTCLALCCFSGFPLEPDL